jgi:hypothetical protein
MIIKIYLRIITYIYKMSSPILPKSIDLTKLRYSEVKTLASGGKTVYINYGTGKLRVQTPVLTLPYGLGEGYEDKNAKKPDVPVVKPPSERKYDLTLSFKELDQNPKIQVFHDKLKEIEQKIIDDAFTNRLEWLKDDYDANKNFVAKLFNPIVKIDKDKTTGKIVGKYPPTFKAKVPYDGTNNKFLFDCYDMENNEIEFETIMNKLKGGRAQLIIELSGIWFTGGKYGCTWKIISGKFQISRNMKIEFLEDSDTEKAVEEEKEENNDEDEDVLPSSEDVPTKVPNSDDELDEPSNSKSVENLPAPPVAAVKKSKSTKK